MFEKCRGPARTLVARDNVCEDMRGAAFTFPVPFTGRALLEGRFTLAEAREAAC